ncbi:hypothetical protein ABZ446_01720 [Streptomyces sp. NPDC005813]|uniref:hypothetical protein n=1 Tax=Streptomyces sp. NPDC005813 TaxID=3155592 RepID=UPI00341163CB
MAALNLIKAAIDGGVTLEDSAVAATVSGDTAPTGANRFLYVKNGSGVSLTVTLATPGTVSGLDVENPTLVIAASKAGIIPLSRVFAGANGRATITYSAVTTVSVAAFELGS